MTYMYDIPVRTCKRKHVRIYVYMYAYMRIHVRTCKLTIDMYCVPVLRTYTFIFS